MRKYWSILMILILLHNCGYHTPSSLSDMPNIGIPREEINTRIRLSAPEGLNTFKIGDAIGLAVEVISNDQVAFDDDYGARIFLRQNDQWTEIDNDFDYQQGKVLLEPTRGDPFKVGVTVVNPRLPLQSDALTIRIVVVGKIYQKGRITNNKTAAYVDVHLTK
jgi:hypothetical protein